MVPEQLFDPLKGGKMTETDYDRIFFLQRVMIIDKLFIAYARMYEDKKAEERLNQKIMRSMSELSKYKKVQPYFGA